MRKSVLTLAIVVAVMSSTGCYHAIVNTGVTPGPTAKHNMWKSSWVAGLVPPKEVNAKEVCGGKDAAIVETQHTVPNMLLALITSGIYTPVTVSVTCGQQPQP